MRDQLISLYRKLFGVPAGLLSTDAGLAAKLEGASAVALCEAAIAQNALFSESYFSAGGFGWKAEQSRQKANVFGELLGNASTSNAREALSQAMGLCLTGRRVVLFLSSPELLTVQDLLIQAKSRRLPLLIQVENRAMAAQGGSRSTSHQAMLMLANSGLTLLVSDSVQQALDFCLIGRRLAETILEPVLLFQDGVETAATEQQVQLPSPTLIQEFLGRAQDQVECANLGERMIFGETRRRVPSWHDLDRPVLQNPLFSDQSQALAGIAGQVYFPSDIPARLAEICSSFARATGRRHQAVDDLALGKAQSMLLVCGSAKAVFQGALAASGIGVAALALVSPLPLPRLLELCQGTGRLWLAQRSVNPGAMQMALQAAFSQQPGRWPEVRTLAYGFDGLPLRAEDIRAFAAHEPSMSAGQRVLGIDLSQQSAHPKRQAMLDELKREYPQLMSLGIRAPLSAAAAQPGLEKPVPDMLRHLKPQPAGFDSLPRFWDQVGIQYQEGTAELLTPDPFLASATVPPLTSTFNALGGTQDWLPQVHGTACSGCGACWVSCPDGAIGALLASPAEFINGALAQGGMDALRPLVGKLAGRISQRARKGEFITERFADLLDEGTVWLEQKSPLAAERKQAVAAATARMTELFGTLEFIKVDKLFAVGEQAKADGGALLSLAVNPDACKSCGLCVAVCPEQAIARAQADVSLERQRWHAWAQARDTDSASIHRLIESGVMDQMAAQMLSRHSLLALAYGDSSEPGSGEKLALRQLLATLEYRQQPLLRRFAGQIAQARAKVEDAIKAALVSALPASDLDRLAGLLASGSARQIEVAKLLPEQGANIDRKQLAELTELGLKLADQHQAIMTGAQGLGRSRYGITLAPGRLLEWAASFPLNPFQAPVTVALNGESADLASGLLQGQMDTALESLRLLRKAKMATGDMGRHAPDPDTLGWQDFDDDEQQILPPLWLIGSEQELGGRDFAAIARLIGQGLPIRILMLAELDMGLDSLGLDGKHLPVQADSRASLGFMAMAQRQAFVAQTAISQPAHLAGAVRDALAFQGSAIIRVHCPSPSRHGLEKDAAIAQSELALRCRVFPLFSYHPGRDGVFGMRLSLQGNPQAESSLLEEHGSPLTPAHWAFKQGRFQAHFQPLADGDPAPTVLLDWVRLSARDKSKKTPIISQMAADGQMMAYSVSKEMAEMAARQIGQWQTLQELAGLITPFTEKVREQALQELAAGHQTDMAAAQAQAEQRLEDARNGLEAEVAARIKARLMALAGYGLG